MFSLNFKNAMPLAAAAFGIFVATTDAQAVTVLTSCATDSADVSGTGGASSASMYSGQADPGNYDFLKGTAAGDAVSSCTTVDTGGQGQYSASDLSGIDGVLAWTEIVKVDNVDTSPNGTKSGVNYDFNPLNGTFSFDAALGSLYSKILAVFKDGNAEPATVVAYGLSGFSDGYAGEYVSMFFNTTDPGSWKSNGALSNWALFGIKDNGGGVGGEIPVPAGLPLLLTAMGLGGFMSWRKRKTV